MRPILIVRKAYIEPSPFAGGDEAVLGELGASVEMRTPSLRQQLALFHGTGRARPHLPAATKRRPIRPPLGLSYAIWMLWFFSGRADALAREHRGRRHADRRLTGWLPPDGKRRAAFASAPSASSAAVTEAYPIGHGPTKSGQLLLSQMSSAGCGGDLSSRTLLTVLTVSSRLACILMILLPARPLRLKEIAMPRARRTLCARRSRPADPWAQTPFNSPAPAAKGNARRERFHFTR
jgi:hypothetical protein